MTEISHLAAIILAAGSGSRSGCSLPKQFRHLAGRSVIGHSVAACLAHPSIDQVIVMCSPGGEADAREALGHLAQDVKFSEGGDSRRDSVANGLELLLGSHTVPSHVLVHDSARPGLSASVIDRLLAALRDGADAVMPVLPVVDTLVADATGHSGDVVDRSRLRRVQTPQGFVFETLVQAHRLWKAAVEPTDDAQMVRSLGHSVRLVEGDPFLDKITLPGDHERMEQLMMASFETRTGFGFDVHRLVEKTELWLCGLRIPHSHGLSGHSDADVAIHALVDAILGAMAEGDIGAHFPPSDPKWRGARSDQFLRFAMQRLEARAGMVTNIDLTIICEAPKIGPYRDQMRARLAGIMNIEPDQVSVKATTTERLGFTGRGEGIAVQAIATLRLPRRASS